MPRKRSENIRLDAHKSMLGHGLKNRTRGKNRAFFCRFTAKNGCFQTPKQPRKSENINLKKNENNLHGNLGGAKNGIGQKIYNCKSDKISQVM